MLTKHFILNVHFSFDRITDCDSQLLQQKESYEILNSKYSIIIYGSYLVGDTKKVCKCRYGYIGRSCEHKDKCQKPESRCLNNGNCTDSGTCNCTDHFYGIFCENKNACFSMPCAKDQTCVLYENSTEKYSCKNSMSTFSNFAIYLILLIIYQ